MASSSACSSSQPDISSRMGPGVRRRTARGATGLTMGALRRPADGRVGGARRERWMELELELS